MRGFRRAFLFMFAGLFCPAFSVAALDSAFRCFGFIFGFCLRFVSCLMFCFALSLLFFVRIFFFRVFMFLCFSCLILIADKSVFMLFRV